MDAGSGVKGWKSSVIKSRSFTRVNMSERGMEQTLKDRHTEYVLSSEDTQIRVPDSSREKESLERFWLFFLLSFFPSLLLHSLTSPSFPSYISSFSILLLPPFLRPSVSSLCSLPFFSLYFSSSLFLLSAVWMTKPRAPNATQMRCR